jgi:hypothetical protein
MDRVGGRIVTHLVRLVEPADGAIHVAAPKSYDWQTFVADFADEHAMPACRGKIDYPQFRERAWAPRCQTTQPLS